MFQKMCDIIPEGQSGNVKVKHFEVSRTESQFTALRAIGGRDSFVSPGTYVHLYVGRHLMMSDTRMEKDSNKEVVCRAHGDVFIAGLGIGLILAPILANPEVTSVTVVEKYHEVVELVEPAIRKLPGGEKLKVIEADILEWTPPKGQKWDVIYFDIWPDICTDNLEEMTTLHRRFARRKNPGGWIESWQRKRLRVIRARERRHRGWW
jgi:spermidine synthase